MKRWSSGLRARELGLGVSGVLPSDPGRDFVLHGEQTIPMLSRLLKQRATQEDLQVALGLARQNENLDTFVKEALTAGRQYAEPSNGRLAGTALLGALGGGGLAYLVTPEPEPVMVMEA